MISHNVLARAKDDDFDFELYRYTPSLAGAAVTAAIFFILTSVHLWRLLRARALYFIAFLVGGVFQTIGYSGRIWSHFDKESLGGFVMQAILILVAPALYAASIYMILARIIKALNAEHLSLVPIKWITKVFVTSDIISFSVQAAGGGLSAGGSLDMFHLGEKVIVAGLFVQIAVFGFFVFVSALFNIRIAKAPTKAASDQVIPWRRHMTILYLASALILVRSIFRVVEYLQGNDGYLVSHEIFLYIFDALLMATVMTLFAIWYVGDLEKKRGDVSDVECVESGAFAPGQKTHE